MPIPFEIIELDRPRKIRFGMTAMQRAEKIMGKPFSAIQDGFGMGDLGVLLYAGMLDDDPDLKSVEQVSVLVDEYADDLMTVIDKVTKAINSAMGNRKPPVLPAEQKGSGTGTPSSK